MHNLPTTHPGKVQKSDHNPPKPRRLECLIALQKLRRCNENFWFNRSMRGVRLRQFPDRRKPILLPVVFRQRPLAEQFKVSEIAVIGHRLTHSKYCCLEPTDSSKNDLCYIGNFRALVEQPRCAQSRHRCVIIVDVDRYIYAGDIQHLHDKLLSYLSKNCNALSRI